MFASCGRHMLCNYDMYLADPTAVNTFACHTIP